MKDNTFYKLIFIFVVALALINIYLYDVKALELNPFAEVKIYEKEIKQDMNNYIKEDFNLKYGSIKLSKTFLWFETDKIAEYSLIHNTDKCFIDCEAIGKVVLYEDMTLFEDIRFLDVNRNRNVDFNYEYFILNNISYEEDEDIIEIVCKDIIDIKTEELIKSCNPEGVGKKKVTKYKEEWIKYDGKVLTKGNYKWKIKANKPQDLNIDWIVTQGSKEFTEWAEWTTANCLASGGSITINGDYCVHTFITNGTFSLNYSYTLQVLAVGGGGAGGTTSNNYGSGGGGGGIVYNNSHIWASGTYPVIIGQGGTSTTTNGNNGGNTTFYNYIAVGGGGGVTMDTNGKNGGSGGGAITNGAIKYGGNSTQGNFGGTGYGNKGGDSNYNAGGGGGGSASAGQNVVTNNDGADGGQGLNFTIFNGTNICYAGGGGGGGGVLGYGLGYCGGGNGSAPYGTNGARSGLSNTGGGGGGNSGGAGNYGANGGSGIVIISYLAVSIDNVPIVTLNNPSDNFKTTNSSIIFNCSATDDIGVYNLSLLINGVINYTITNSTPNSNLSFEIIRTLPDNNYIWSCIAYDFNSSTTSASRSLTIDSTPPILNLYSPSGTQYTLSLPYNVTLNYTASDVSLSSCYYNHTENSSITYIPCNSSTILTFSTYINKINNNATDSSLTNYETGTGYINFTTLNNLTLNVNALISYKHEPDITSGVFSCYNYSSSSFVNFASLDTNVNSSYVLPRNCLISTNIQIKYELDSFGIYSGKLYNLDLSLKPNKTIYYYANDSVGFTTYNSTNIFINLLTSYITYENKTFEEQTTDICYYATASSVTTYNANLTYNNTLYTMNSSINGNNIIFCKTITTPKLTNDALIYFYINYTIDNSTQNTQIYNQTVYNIPNFIFSSTPCTPLALNFTVFDEINFSVLNENTIDYNFKWGFQNTSYINQYGSLTSASSLYICINDSISPYWVISYGEIQYSKDNYVDRRYYLFNNTIINNNTQTIPLYSLLSTLQTSFQLEVESSSLIPYENKYTRLLRWYPELNEYKTVDMGLTDEDGTTIIHVVSEDVDYRIGVYELNGTLIKLADPTRMVCLLSPCTYTLTIKPTDTDYTSFLGIDYSFTYDTTNKLWSFIYSDSSGKTTTMNLTVYRMNNLNEVVVCSNTYTGSSGVITCNTSLYTGTLKGVIYRSASPNIPFAQKIISTTTTAFTSAYGLFLSIIIGIPIILIFAFMSPILAVLGGVVALIPAYFFGSINITILGGFAILGGLVMHFLKRVG